MPKETRTPREIHPRFFTEADAGFDMSTYLGRHESGSHVNTSGWTTYVFETGERTRESQFNMFGPYVGWSMPAFHEARTVEWANAIDNFVSGVFASARLEVSLTVLAAKVQWLDSQNESLRSELKSLSEQFKRLQTGLLVSGSTHGEDIDWEIVTGVVKRVSTALGWNANVSLQPGTSVLVISLPIEQRDLLANSTIAFYEAVAEQLPQQAFKSVQFDFEVPERDDSEA